MRRINPDRRGYLPYKKILYILSHPVNPVYYFSVWKWSAAYPATSPNGKARVCNPMSPLSRAAFGPSVGLYYWTGCKGQIQTDAVFSPIRNPVHPEPSCTSCLLFLRLEKISRLSGDIAKRQGGFTAMERMYKINQD
jgi:hypothetical protein